MTCKLYIQFIIVFNLTFVPEFMSQFKSEESVFNMAIAYLTRIDKLLYRCQEAAINQDIDSWRQNLGGVFRELSVKLNDTEETDIVGDMTKIKDLKTLLDNKITYEEATFANINYLANKQEVKIKYKTIILMLLDKLEIKIRRQLQKKGMLLPSRNDPRYAVLNR